MNSDAITIIFLLLIAVNVHLAQRLARVETDLAAMRKEVARNSNDIAQIEVDLNEIAPLVEGASD